MKCSQCSQEPRCFKPTRENLGTIARCGVCLEQYSKQKRAPVVTPCGHTFCRICISKICRGRVIICPVCREVTMFGFGQLGRDVSFMELLEKNNLLADDDTSDPHAPYPNFDLDQFSDQELGGLDVSVVTPFSDFFFKFLKVFYGQVVEKLMNECRFHVGIEDDATLSNHFQKAAIQWEEVQTMFDRTLRAQEELLTTLKAWRKRMTELNTDDDTSMPSDLLDTEYVDDDMLLLDITSHLPYNHITNRIISGEFAEANISNATIQDFQQPGSWRPMSTLFRSRRLYRNPDIEMFAGAFESAYREPSEPSESWSNFDDFHPVETDSMPFGFENRDNPVQVLFDNAIIRNSSRINNHNSFNQNQTRNNQNAR